MEGMLRASAGYSAFGVASAIFHREFSRLRNVDTETIQTQLTSLHGHAFTLGGLFMLTVLSLEKNFRLSAQKDFQKFTTLYHSGLGITLLCLLIQGCLSTAGKKKSYPVKLAAHLGHGLIGGGLFYFYRALSLAIKSNQSLTQ